MQNRNTEIEIVAGNGETDALIKLLGSTYTQEELDLALENAIAYSQTSTANYLLSLGADITSNNYQGCYYAAHNNELEGVKFAVAHGIDVNTNSGMLINTAIMTSINTNTTVLILWLINNGASKAFLTTESLNLVEKYGTEELKQICKNGT